MGRSFSEINECEIEESIRKTRMIGAVSTKVAPEVPSCLLAAPSLRTSDWGVLRRLFAPYCVA